MHSRYSPHSHLNIASPSLTALLRALGYGHDDRFFPGQQRSHTCSQFLVVLVTLSSELRALSAGTPLLCVPAAA